MSVLLKLENEKGECKKIKYPESFDELIKAVKELEEYLRANEKGLLRYQYELGYNVEELEKICKEKYRNLGTEESQMYCICRKRMKRNRTSWSIRGAEALIKVIAYQKNNDIKDLMDGKLKEQIENELKSRFPHSKKLILMSPIYLNFYVKFGIIVVTRCFYLFLLWRQFYDNRKADGI